MIGDPERKWGCKECNWTGVQSDLLTAPNPFDPEDIISGCPKCKSINSYWEICDEPGCTKEAGCGFPVPGGYRRTCFDHSCFKEKK